MKQPLAILLLGLAASLAGAATPRFVDATAADAFKVYWLERAEQPPVIDGQLDEALWQRLQPLTDWGTTNYGRQRSTVGAAFIPGEIDFRAAWDDHYLYLAARCYHKLHPNDMQELRRKVGNRADAIYARECLEIHIDGNLDHATTFQAIVNPLNEKMMIWHYDFGWGLLDNPDYGLDADWDTAAGIADDHWTLEARIALRDLQVEPRVGAMFGLNPCWFDWADSLGGKGEKYWWQFVTWSTHDDSHHDPRLYGRFILVDRAPATLAAGLRLAFPDLDRRTLMIQAANGYLRFADGQATEVGFDVQVRTEVKEVGALCDRLKTLLAAGQAQRCGHLAKALPEQEAALAAIETELAAAAAPARGRIAAMRLQLSELRTKLDDGYWVARQDALLAALPAPAKP